jgi:hypothetical protein
LPLASADERRFGWLTPPLQEGSLDVMFADEFAYNFDNVGRHWHCLD